MKINRQEILWHLPLLLAIIALISSLVASTLAFFPAIISLLYINLIISLGFFV